MKWFSTKKLGNQKGLQQLPQKIHKVIVNLKKISVCCNLPLLALDEDRAHQSQILKLAPGTHTEWILNRDKKHNEIYQKIAKKLSQRQNVQSQTNSQFTPATNLKTGTYASISRFVTQNRISEKIKPRQEDHFKILTNPLM